MKKGKKEKNKVAILETKPILFLEANTELLVSVNPGPDLTPDLRAHIESFVPTSAHKRDDYVRVKLLEDLMILFELHESGNISRDLLPCRCLISALPNEHIRSLNQAYQRISAVFEPYRSSVGGRVYDNVYYQNDSRVWTPLDVKRNELYRPYKTDFEIQAGKIKERQQKGRGIRIPPGTCLLVREKSAQPSMFFVYELKEILAGASPYDEYLNMVAFGPFDNKTLWRHVQSLEGNGFIYGKDFVHFQNNLPEWCRMRVFPELG